MHLDKSCLLPGVCRLRLGAAAPIRTPCPNRISAFDKAVKCFAEKPAENVITPVLGITFDSLGEASGDALTDLLLVNYIQWSTIFI